MVSVMDLIDAINLLLLAKFPTTTFHINNIPEGFTRPSIFIELVTDDSKSASISLTEEGKAIQITYFSPVDEYRIADGPTQYAVSETIKNVFKKGYVKVGDRAIKVTGISGGPRDNEIYLTVTFEYLDDRPEDPDAPIYETMQELKFKI